MRCLIDGTEIELMVYVSPEKSKGKRLVLSFPDAPKNRYATGHAPAEILSYFIEENIAQLDSDMMRKNRDLGHALFGNINFDRKLDMQANYNAFIVPNSRDINHMRNILICKLEELGGEVIDEELLEIDIKRYSDEGEWLSKVKASSKDSVPRK